MIDKEVNDLEKAIKENMGKRVVTVRFDKYYEAYENYKNKDEKDIKKYRELLLDYMRYTSKSSFIFK